MAILILLFLLSTYVAPVAMIAAIVIAIIHRRSHPPNPVQPIRPQNPTVQVYPANPQINQRIAELKAKISAEIDKPSPNTAALKQWQNEIRNLESTPNPNIISSSAPAPTAPIANQAPTPRTMPNSPNLPNQLPVRPMPPRTNSSLDGQNLALLAGGFLIIAGAGGVVATDRGYLGLVILFLMMFIFYIGGFVVRRNSKLRPAGNTFIGIGMALLPFVATLLAKVSGVSGEVIWLLTSVVGAIIYGLTAYLLKSKAVGYIVMVVLVSFTCSLSATLSLSAVWYFVFVMVLSIIINLTNLAIKKSQLSALNEITSITGRWLPLITLATATFCFALLSSQEFLLILSIALAQILLHWILNRSEIEEVELRLGTIWWIWVLFWTLAKTQESSNLVAMFVAGIAAVASTIVICVFKKQLKPPRFAIESIMIAVNVILMLFLSFFVNNSSYTISLLSTISLSIIAILYFAQFCVFRNPNYALGVCLALFFLPWTVGLGIISITALAYGVVYLLLGILIFAMSYLMGKDLLLKANNYFLFLGASTLCGIISAGFLANTFDTSASFMDIFSYLAVGAITLLMGLRLKNQSLTELSCYEFTLIPVRLVSYSLLSAGVVSPDSAGLAAIISSHIICVVLFVTSFWRDKRLSDGNANSAPRATIGAIILTCAVGLVTLGSTNIAYIVIFIVDQVVLIVAGLLMRDKALMVIGAVGVFLAVMRFTADIPYAWMFILGLLLIGFVVWGILHKRQD